MQIIAKLLCPQTQTGHKFQQVCQMLIRELKVLMASSCNYNSVGGPPLWSMLFEVKKGLGDFSFCSEWHLDAYRIFYRVNKPHEGYLQSPNSLMLLRLNKFTSLSKEFAYPKPSIVALKARSKHVKLWFVFLELWWNRLFWTKHLWEFNQALKWSTFATSSCVQERRPRNVTWSNATKPCHFIWNLMALIVRNC